MFEPLIPYIQCLELGKNYFSYISVALSCTLFYLNINKKQIIYTYFKIVTLIIGNKLYLSLMMALIERYPNA